MFYLYFGVCLRHRFGSRINYAQIHILAMTVRSFDQNDYSQISEIYRQGIATGLATFQTDAPNWESWDKSHLPKCRLAVFDEDIMAGWAALTPVSSSCSYAGVAEVSIYISNNHKGQGIGQLLLHALITESEQAGFWTLQSAIFADNIPSVKLHEKCGFRIVGIREKIGKKDGVWKDNVIMERRSTTVGV